MKCIQCALDSKKKDRAGGKCPKCGTPFAFEPTAGEPTDSAFQHWIERVSAKGQVKFTRAQLYYEARRASVATLPARKTAFWTRLIVAGLIGVVCLAVVPLTAGVSLVGVLISVVAAGIMASGGPDDTVIDPDRFTGLYRKWVGAHGSPIALAAAPQPSKKRRVDPGELDDYSFDRAVITDSADIVDMLVANRFHFENNCAILSVDGHPEGAFDQVRRMLRNNPRIEVFALHDATVEGCTLAWRLRNDPSWFLGIGRVYDVGLRPAHAAFFAYAVLDRPRPVQPHPGRSLEEDAWLGGHYLELAAIRPEQLIKRLYRAMTHQPDAPVLVDGGSGATDVMLFGTDAGASDGGADSFG